MNRLTKLIGRLKKSQRYSGYWNDPQRDAGERAITHVVTSRLLANGEFGHVSEIKSVQKDPPDCRFTIDENIQVGAEVTELVNEVSVRGIAQAGSIEERRLIRPHEYKTGELICKIQEIIDKKGKGINKSTLGEMCWLIIHTDECSLRDRGELLKMLEVGQELNGGEWDRVFLLSSYDPNCRDEQLFEFIFEEDYCRIALH
jgi:hypothetical protein